MTEAEWLTCTDPQKMLDFLKGRASERKLRLFSVACCRRIWHLLSDGRSRSAVEAAERFADGITEREAVLAARDAAREAKWEFLSPDVASLSRASNAAFDVTRDTGRSAATNCWLEASRAVSVGDTNCCDEAEAECQSVLLHDIFGNPFCPVALDSSWLTPAVVSITRSIYDTRSFDRMPELADAFDAAGCSNTDILQHCRGSGPHVRGCWVLDLVLGKE